MKISILLIFAIAIMASTQILMVNGQHDFDACSSNTDCYKESPCERHSCNNWNGFMYCSCRKMNRELAKPEKNCKKSTGTCHMYCQGTGNSSSQNPKDTIAGYLCKTGTKTRCVCGKS